MAMSSALGMTGRPAAMPVVAAPVVAPVVAAAEAEVKVMCEKLLANTVIESYRVEIL